MTSGERAFYTIVLIVGATVASADGNPDSSELRQLKKYFDVDPDKFPQAASIYNGQLHNPLGIESALKPFIGFFERNAETSEALLYGMCLVCLADGVVHPKELDVLWQLSTILKMSPASRDRVFEAANIPRRNASNQTDLRSRKLAVLGLSRNATKTQIKSEYVRLVKRYHPDALRSQGLPDAEIRHSEEILREITIAYKWLSEND